MALRLASPSPRMISLSLLAAATISTAWRSAMALSDCDACWPSARIAAACAKRSADMRSNVFLDTSGASADLRPHVGGVVAQQRVLDDLHRDDEVGRQLEVEARLLTHRGEQAEAQDDRVLADVDHVEGREQRVADDDDSAAGGDH